MVDGGRREIGKPVSTLAEGMGVRQGAVDKENYEEGWTD
jgi:hypothetical protein